MDIEGAGTVNIIGGNTDEESPQDLYSSIHHKVTEILRQEADSGDINAITWLANIESLDREMIKKVVMPLPYGIGFSKMKKNLEDELILRLQTSNLIANSSYLTRTIRDAITKSLPKAFEVKDELVSLATYLSKYNLPIVWTTPTGFQVFQDIRNKTNERIRATVYIKGKAITTFYTIQAPDDSGGKIVTLEQQKKIVANFIHSFDAAHMMLTINLLLKKGVKSFATIHDSFGVHSLNVEKLNQMIRRTFYSIYKERVLDNTFADYYISFDGESSSFISDKWKSTLRSVLAAKYFFS